MLPSSAVDAVFAKCAVRYGSAWFAKWDGIPLESVKADWARELAGFDADAIRHALEHLPEGFPPDVAQFKALCLRCPKPAAPALPAPKANPRRVAEHIARMADMQSKRRPRQWADELQAREKAGEVLSPAQKAMWRDGVRAPDLGSGGLVVGFTPIPVHLHPPGGLRDKP